MMNGDAKLVEVVDWATTSQAFRKIIEEQKVLVQAGQGKEED
jgi:hypothetical protein